MPETIRRAVPKILAPAYRRFVLDAPGELERSVGLTLVHLMRLEICDQVQMAVLGADPQSLDAILNDPESMIERHLRLASVKCQTAKLLLKLRMADQMLPQQRRAGFQPAIDRGAGCQPAVDCREARQPAVTQDTASLPDNQSVIDQFDDLLQTGT
jgi:hypothetical protein